uniref:MMPL family transporter n=1 Tax=Nitrosomonas sp. TaxID=42353 RepID=UPI0025FBC535
GLLSIMQATLTLPGMAALALTVGMAIDANVLINERIRDEFRAGASPQLAIHAGYERAFGTILDSNITTLIAGIALFAFGSGPVKGFAVVLCLGIMTSVFTAIFVSRGMVNFMYGSLRKLDNIPIGITWIPEPSLVTGKSDLLSENEITETTGSTEPKRSEQTKESNIKPDIVSQTSAINEDKSVVEDSAKARAISKNKAKSKRKSADTKKTKQ